MLQDMIKKFSESAEVRVSKHHPLKTNSATLAVTMASIDACQLYQYWDWRWPFMFADIQNYDYFLYGV